TAGDFNGDGVPDFGVGTDVGTLTYLANSNSSKQISSFSIATQSGALASLTSLRITLDCVLSELGNMGSAQSRLSVAASNLSVAREYDTAAASQIRDVDVAAESSQLVKNEILQQAGAAVLAQANTQPEIALSLLKNI